MTVVASASSTASSLPCDDRHVPATARLFVYGTLMPGDVRWPHLEPFATAWTEATAHGRLYDTGSDFPCAVFVHGASGGQAIPGVVVDLLDDRREEALDAMDRIEGFLYRRIEIETSVGPAWSYEWMGRTDDLRPIRSWAGP
jgi:gamma-glutamylcyclotransferase (GGCT)/AIG2-like uncharacterized protein YtfP